VLDGRSCPSSLTLDFAGVGELTYCSNQTVSAQGWKEGTANCHTPSNYRRFEFDVGPGLARAREAAKGSAAKSGAGMRVMACVPARSSKEVIFWPWPSSST
jgi:hypothetical protein